jgi:hypothetical protein
MSIPKYSPTGLLFAYLRHPLREAADTSLSHLVLVVLIRDMRVASAGKGWFAADPRWEELTLRVLDHHDYDSAWELLACSNSTRGVAAMLERLPKLESLGSVFHAIVLLPPSRVLPALEAELARRKGTGDEYGLKKAIDELRSRA